MCSLMFEAWPKMESSSVCFLLQQEMLETCVGSLGWEDPLEEEIATHPSILAWKIPWTEETDEL